MKTLGILILFTSGLLAQFDAVSIRPTAPDDRTVTIDVGPGGRFVAHGYSAKLLVQRAFGMKGYQVSGGPSWLDEDRYDVVARASVQGDLTEEQLRPLLQAALIDRFQLHYHKLTKQTPGFAVGIAGSASKLKPSARTEEQSERTIQRRGAAVVGEGLTTKTSAVILGAYLGRPVADETGLKGLYDFQLAWTERADQVAPERVRPEEGGITLITALREQLGLKLTQKRIDVETIVIDSAQKPSAN